jgi:hypothetical protein
MKVGVIMRFHYNKDDTRFNWRFNHFKKEVLPRLKNQTYKNFDICIGVNDWQIPLFKNLGVKTFTADWNIRYKVNKNNPNKKYFHDFISFEELKGLDKYDIQIGLDSDDLVEPKYVEIIKKEVEGHIKKNPDKSLHLCYQPQLIRDGEKSSMKQYGIKRGSAFMGLYIPKNKEYYFIYSNSHIEMPLKADCFKLLPEGYCYALAHELNESTGK